jgi:hypothetical protein
MNNDRGRAVPGPSVPNGAHGRLCAGAMILLAATAAAAQPARAMDIKPVFDSSITSLSDAAQIESAFNTAAGVFDRAFANPATVNITVSWGSVAGEAIPAGDVSASMDNLSGAYSYAGVVSYLTAASKANPSDTVLASAVSHLPKSDPTKLGQFEIPYAEAKALGILPGAFPMMDGYIGFDSKVAYDFNPVGGITAGDYDFEGLAAHEIEEVLGRITGLQSSGVSWATPFDLDRYAATGVSSFTYGGKAYFSVNGGLTDLGNFNYTGGGDRSDWLTLGSSTDVQDAYVSTGKALTLTGNDLEALDALGWGVSKVIGSTPLATVTTFSPPGGALSAVPEPATWAMMIAGAALIGASARRRRWGASARRRRWGAIGAE